MSRDELDARWAAAQRRDKMRFWAPVIVACIAMILSGIGLLLTSTRVDSNASSIDHNRTATRVAAKTATSARVDLDDIIRVLKKKHIVKNGRNGLQGSTGPRGDRGPVGARGPQGLRGAPGPDGADAQVSQSDLLSVITSFCAAHNCRGPEGPRGQAGASGPPGPAGPAMQRHFVVSFPRSDGSTASLTCDDVEGDGTYACAPSAA